MFLTVRMVYAQVRGRQGLGLGDVKLALVAGAWLDWMMIPIAIDSGVGRALWLFVRAIRNGAIDFVDEPGAIWSVFSTGHLDLLDR